MNLIKYSFRVFLVTVVVYIMVNYRDLPFSVFIAVPLSVFPWIVYDLILPDHIKSWKSAVIILEFISVLSAIVLLEASLFSVFLVLLFYQIIKMFSFKTGIIIISGIVILLLTVWLLLYHNIWKLIVLIPVVAFGYILDRIQKGESSEMKAEIEAQQKQIDGKNKLLSTLAHELRTPLAVIKTSTEIILEERPGKINSTQKRFLTAVIDNTMRMVRFVDTILASIKVEYAWFRMNKKSMDVRNVIKKVCTDLLPFITSRGQELKYTYPNLISRTIADENWIQQVLINLIHNASKHIGKNGRIIISVTENEQCIVISVSDDGSGIINQDKPKIFSEFYQGSESDEENMDGVGLGLSIVKKCYRKA